MGKSGERSPLLGPSILECLILANTCAVVGEDGIRKRRRMMIEAPLGGMGGASAFFCWPAATSLLLRPTWQHNVHGCYDLPGV